jgi:uncharacterized membrane protein
VSKPNVNIVSRLHHRLTEAIALIMILVNTGLVLGYYSRLPQTIPIHFNVSGEADAYDDKSMLLYLAGAAVVMFLILGFLGRVPRLFQYPFRITPENAKRQYENAAAMLRLMNIVIASMFAYISYATIAISLGTMKGLGAWCLPTMVMVVMTTSMFFLYRAYKRQ